MTTLLSLLLIAFALSTVFAAPVPQEEEEDKDWPSDLDDRKNACGMKWTLRPVKEMLGDEVRTVFPATYWVITCGTCEAIPGDYHYRTTFDFSKPSHKKTITIGCKLGDFNLIPPQPEEEYVDNK